MIDHTEINDLHAYRIFIFPINTKEIFTKTITGKLTDYWSGSRPARLVPLVLML